MSSTDKLNFRLVCTSDYIQYFSIIIKYKLIKHYIIPNTFSRLEAEGKEVLEDQGEGELDVLFTTTLIEMSKEF